MDDNAVNCQRGDFISFLALINCKLIRPFEELFRGEFTNLQLLTLCALSESGPIPVTALADRLYVPKQQMTKLIACLTKNGHIRRTRSPNDHRIILVELTDSTEQLLAERRALFVRSVGEIISHYDGDQEVSLFMQHISGLNSILSSLPNHLSE